METSLARVPEQAKKGMAALSLAVAERR